MSQRWVIVTGATRGLGLAIARNLLTEGYSVIGTGRTSAQGFSDLVEHHGERCQFEILDLASPDSIQQFAAKCPSAVYGLVNNAAIAHDGVLATMHATEIGDVIRVNVIGTILLTKSVVRKMLLSRTGRVINISSIIASTGFNGLSVYAASKSALTGFSKSLARELGRVGVTVNVVAPGYMSTDMSSGISAANRERIVRRSPLGRLVDPAEVAAAVSYLLSDAAAGTTGIELTIDAGSTA